MQKTMQAEELTSQKSIKTETRFKRVIAPLFVLVLTLYFFVIFLSPKSIDVGFIGEWLRYHLNLFIGATTIFVPLGGLYWVLERYVIAEKYHNKQHSSALSFIGFVFLILGLCLFFNLINVPRGGGFFGLWFSQILLSSLGFFGSLLACVFMIVFALSLFISINWRLLFIATGMKAMSISTSSDIADASKGELKRESLEEAPSNSYIIQKREIKSENLDRKSAKLGEGIDIEVDELPALSIEEKKSLKNRLSALWAKKPILSAHKEITDKKDENHSVFLAEKEASVSNEVPLTALKSIDDVLDDEQDKLPIPILKPSSEVEEIETTTKLQKKVKSVSKKAPQTVIKLKTKELPPLNLLNADKVEVVSYTDEQLTEMGQRLENNLKSFNIEAVVKAIQPGPVVTLFEINPAAGVKVGQIVQLAKDLARSLVVASVRVVEVIPGKSYIGIEIPNNQREPVNFHEMLSSAEFQKQKKPLTIALGKDIGGAPVVIDLAKTPHLLVAGTTGSGKSVGINSMIVSLLYKSLPDEVKMILIDPKMLELSVYEGIPHLITPVVTDMGESTAALKWAVAEMEKRYKLMSLLGVRNIIGFNEKIIKAKKEGKPLKDPMYKTTAVYSLEEGEAAPLLEKMPYIVIVIDEFADLIMVVGKQIEELIARIAQKARAAGIHLILATQRPSVNVITGLIKANIPTRLSFQVSTKIDSRTILDQGGAEQLLGLGDMLYSAPGQGVPLRAHGAFVSDEEVHNAVEWLKQNHHPPVYIENLEEKTEQANLELGIGGKEGEDDLFSAACEIVFRTRKASISRIQRELRIGYNRAARLIEEMEQQGLLSAPDERGNRDILAGKTGEQ
jgi:S-DNA-T family DNA segregation ATPase FtsK/SpoIIIE